jgi:hypothetical protein
MANFFFEMGNIFPYFHPNFVHVKGHFLLNHKTLSQNNCCFQWIEIDKYLKLCKASQGRMNVFENNQSGIIRGNASVFGEFSRPGYKKMPFQ